ncbi:MFS transporter [Neobacillus vireti]|uniref:MFS transporter n=1 Tax=Neobacillus vireti TaxID=220686 RepID=UPI00300027B5
MEGTTEGYRYDISISEKKRLVLILCILLLFSVMNATMFMVSIPDISESFGIRPSKVSWVVTSYIIFYAIGSMLYGNLSDIYSIRTLLIIGNSLFVIGSLLGFFASEFYLIVLARIIQACGASSFPAIVFTIPARLFPKEKGRMLGLFSSTLAFGSGLGPVLGGVIAGFLNWQFIFLFSSFAACTLPLLVFLLPKEKKKAGRVDFIGAIILAVSIVAFILFNTSFNWNLLMISLVFIVLFVWWIKRRTAPFINPAMFKNRQFTAAIISGFLCSFIMFGNMFALPQMLRDVNHLDTIQIGVVLFPGAMASALIGGLAGRSTDHFGPKRITFIGLSLIIVGTMFLSSFIGLSPIVISSVFIFCLIAFPFIQTSMTSIISNEIQGEHLGTGMGIYNLTNFIAGAFSGSIIGKFLDYQHAEILFNPFAQSSVSGNVYSNLFFLMALITIMNGIFFFVMHFLNNKGINVKRESENTILK